MLGTTGWYWWVGHQGVSVMSLVNLHSLLKEGCSVTWLRAHAGRCIGKQGVQHTFQDETGDGEKEGWERRSWFST